jgi:DNA repair protein RadD
MTTHQLRPYQQQAVSEIRTAFTQRNRSVLFVLPTGGGKTTIFSHITEQTAARGNRVCVLVHRQELLRQASASLDQMGVPHGLVAANHSMDLSRRVQIASVATLARRLHHFPQEFSSCWWWMKRTTAMRVHGRRCWGISAQRVCWV